MGNHHILLFSKILSIILAAIWGVFIVTTFYSNPETVRVFGGILGGFSLLTLTFITYVLAVPTKENSHDN